MARAHGEPAYYQFGPFGSDSTLGCRCDSCRVGKREYQQRNRARITPAYVDATSVRMHVRDLMAHGVGFDAICTISGVSRGGLTRLLYGQQDRAPSKRVRVATRNALLGVRRTDTHVGAFVPAGPTWAIVDDLLRRGWTKKAISHGIGQGGVNLQLSKNTITKESASMVASLAFAPVPPGLNPVLSPPAPVEVKTRRRQEPNSDRQPEVNPLLRALGARQWVAKAICAGPDVPTWMFFPDVDDRPAIKAAKRVCAACPVQRQCGEAGVNEQGIWGGMTEKERVAKYGNKIA